MFRAPVRPEVELRLLEERYSLEIFARVDADREYLRAWLTWVDSTHGPDDVSAFARQGLQQFAKGLGFHAGIWEGGRFVGCVGLKPINWQDSKVELGYWLSSEHQGKGLITDSCRTVVRHLFEDLRLNRVDIRVAVGNERSAAVARRLGAEFEGVERKAARLPGRFVDMQRFAILATS